ncbi:MAG: hypothetical protein ACFFAN_05475 [Promethearchaeota archaeon]
MEPVDLEEIYKIDTGRLYKYFNRMKNQFQNWSPNQLVAKFLNNQSIGNSVKDVLSVLNYYKDKLASGKKLLDLAFEWIRAQKIRLEYKKYLIRGRYPLNNLNLAIDDCIVEFFLEYDKYVRKILKKDSKEHEISALFEIFLNPYDIKTFDVKKILEQHKNKAPTILKDENKINTNLITLRSGLSEIIINDYNRVLIARNEEQELKEQKLTKTLVPIKEEIQEFNGTHLERIIKTYCFNKEEIRTKTVESAVTNFLTSYFRFGTFYNYEDFKEILIKSLAEYLLRGLTENVKKSYTLEMLKNIIRKSLNEFREIQQIKVLDGVAWINDLKPVLKKFVIKFVDELFLSKESEISQEQIVEKPKEEKSKKEIPSDGIDFSELFDLNLEVEEYRNRLETSLKNSNKSMIEKRNFIRKKVQEFLMQKRKKLNR